MESEDSIVFDDLNISEEIVGDSDCGLDSCESLKYVSKISSLRIQDVSLHDEYIDYKMKEKFPESEGEFLDFVLEKVFDAESLKIPAIKKVDDFIGVQRVDDCNAEGFVMKEVEYKEKLTGKRLSDNKRPSRLCIFCGQMKQKLSRHLKNKHGKEPLVVEAVNQPKLVSKKLFAKIRREGILIYNKSQSSTDNPIYQREKSGTKYKNLMRCSACNSFISKRFFTRHAQKCSLSTINAVEPIPVSTESLDIPKSLDLDPGFVRNVLGKIRNDEIGKLCCTDENIVYIGSKLYWKLHKKEDKAAEVFRSVRGDMRRLANCYNIFKQLDGIHALYSNSLDMFNRSNFEQLSEAIELYTKREDLSLKAGLKQNLYYLIKKSATLVQYSFYSRKKDDEAAEISKFIQSFKGWQDYLFGDATYHLNKKRQINLRKPSRLPQEDDLLIVKNHVIELMSSICSKFHFDDESSYKKLRNAACARITLLNGRRGGEPARILLADWLQGENDEWIDKQRLKKLDSLDRILVKSMKVIYMTGEGNNHLVPVIIPGDTILAMKKLSNESFRKVGRVLASNKFIFASSKGSENHVSGWHVVNKICSKLVLKSPKDIIATKNRHRISTLFASLDVEEKDKELFYSHMGHSEKMNQDFYQAPLALLELTRVGKQLMKIDAGQSDVIQDLPTKESYNVVDKESDEKVVDKESDENIVKENDSHTLTLKGSGVFGIKEKVGDFPLKKVMVDNPTLKNKCSSSISEEQEEISVKAIESNIGANFTKVFNGLNLKVYPKRSLKKVNYANVENNEEKVQESESDYTNESQDKDSENFDLDEKRDLSSSIFFLLKLTKTLLHLFKIRKVFFL
nr:uncharacterized protein LOC124812135 [Hydra vulgaris]